MILKKVMIIIVPITMLQGYNLSTYVIIRKYVDKIIKEKLLSSYRELFVSKILLKKSFQS